RCYRDWSSDVCSSDLVVPDHDVFFEFIPFREFSDDGKLNRSHPVRHTLANIEVGVQYAVVITSCAGLWSYLIGDTVCFESRDPRSEERREGKRRGAGD